MCAVVKIIKLFSKQMFPLLNNKRDIDTLVGTSVWYNHLREGRCIRWWRGISPLSIYNIRRFSELLRIGIRNAIFLNLLQMWKSIIQDKMNILEKVLDTFLTYKIFVIVYLLISENQAKYGIQILMDCNRV